MIRISKDLYSFDLYKTRNPNTIRVEIVNRTGRPAVEKDQQILLEKLGIPSEDMETAIKKGCIISPIEGFNYVILPFKIEDKEIIKARIQKEDLSQEISLEEAGDVIETLDL